MYSPGIRDRGYSFEVLLPWRYGYSPGTRNMNMIYYPEVR